MKSLCHQSCWSLAALLGLALVGHAQSIEHQKQGPARLLVTARYEQGVFRVPLAEELLVTFTVEGQGPLEVQLAQPIISNEFWKSSLIGKTEETDADGRMSARQTYKLDPLKPGRHELTLEPLRFRDKPGDWQVIQWQPLPVEVLTTIAQPDTANLRDITAIEELPEEPSRWSMWRLVGLGGRVLLALGGVATWLLLLRRRRRRRRRPPLTAEEWATRELDRLAALDLPAAGHVERFHRLLSNIVRAYLEKRWSLPARRQTTEEFLQSMAGSSTLSADQQAFLREFLEKCDLAKFAGLQPSSEKCKALLMQAAVFVTAPPTHA